MQTISEVKTARRHAYTTVDGWKQVRGTEHEDAARTFCGLALSTYKWWVHREGEIHITSFLMDKVGKDAAMYAPMRTQLAIVNEDTHPEAYAAIQGAIDTLTRFTLVR